MQFSHNVNLIEALKRAREKKINIKFLNYAYACTYDNEVTKATVNP